MPTCPTPFNGCVIWRSDRCGVVSFQRRTDGMDRWLSNTRAINDFRQLLEFPFSILTNRHILFFFYISPLTLRLFINSGTHSFYVIDDSAWTKDFMGLSKFLRDIRQSMFSSYNPFFTKVKRCNAFILDSLLNHYSTWMVTRPRGTLGIALFASLKKFA